MKRILLFTLSVIYIGSAFGGHRAGGYYYWDCINDSTYVITFVGRVDCAHDYDKKTKFCLQGSLPGDPNDGTYETDSTYTVDFPVAFCPLIDDCEKNDYYNWQSIVVYTDTIVLQSPISPSYTLYFCDGGGRPDSDNSTNGSFYTEANFSILTPCNSAPRPTTNYDAIYCIGDSSVILNNYVDPDGDSLSFYLTSCSYNATQPMNYNNPPLSPVNPFTSATGWTLDSAGNIYFLPTQQQHGWICLMVEQWNNGSLISTNVQNIYINIIDCDYALAPVDTPQVVQQTLVLNQGCSGMITTTGYNEANITYTSIYPLPFGTYDTYLSCSSGCDTTWVSAQPGFPPYVDYQVCGTPETGCDTVNSVCDTVRVYFNNTLSVAIAPQNPVICFGSSSVTLTAVSSGGQSPYALMWSTGSSATSITVSSAGWYYVTVTDQSDYPCNTDADSVYVTVYTLPITADAGADTNICAGDSMFLQGSVQVASGGVWSGGGGTFIPDSATLNAVYVPSQQEVLIGQVELVLTTTGNGSCPAVTDTVILTINRIIASVDSLVTISCFSGNDGLIQVGVAGGAPNYLYTWNTVPPQTTYTAVGLTAGTYTVTISDYLGCDTTLTAAVTEPGPLVLAADTLKDVSCSGGTDGLAGIVASGATPPYSYLWNSSPPQVSPQATGLPAGSYTVTVTDANNCTATLNMTVSEPAPLQISATVVAGVSCFGGSDGQTQASATGGTLPYNFSWNTTPVQNTPTATGLAAGSYISYVTDTNGCWDSAWVVVSQPPVLSSVIGNYTDVSCFGNSDGTATASPSGGTPPYSYVWNSAPVQTGVSATGLPPGNYDVTVTDSNGCTVTNNVVINEPTLLTANIPSSSGVLCNGGATGLATASASGGTPPYSYTWNTSPLQMTATATGLTAGIFTVTITDYNGCTAGTSVLITEPAALVPSITSITNVSCYGGNNGSTVVASSGGTSPYQYQWSTVPVQTTTTATGLSAASYTVTVTDSNNCFAVTALTVTEPAELQVSLSSTAANCGNSDGSATAVGTGGITPYTYAWSTAPVQTTATATGLATGIYTVTITDPNGCAVTGSVAVQDLVVTVSVLSVTDVSCYGGSDGAATISATGGTIPYTYSWSTNPVQTDTTATGLTAGNYFAVVTDNNGCQATSVVTVGSPPPIINSYLVTGVSCNGGASGVVTVNTSGQFPPYTYLWNTVPAQVSATATGLTAGTYSVTVTDSTGCDSAGVVTVPEPPLLSAAQGALSDVGCFGDSTGSAQVIAIGGTPPYTYAWNTSPVQTLATATGLPAGMYPVTVTDNNGCTATAGFLVNQPVQLAASISTASNITCNGAADGQAVASASGGTTPYTWLWNSTPLQTTQTATALAPGFFTVSVTDQNGCIDTAGANIAEPPLLMALNGGVTHISCNGIPDGTATVIPFGGTTPYAYVWNTSPPQTTATAIGLPAGSFTVTLTDVNGCTDSTSFAIGEPTTLNPVVTSVTNVYCDGGSNGAIALSVAGGTPGYIYSWNTSPPQSTPSISNLTAGNYTVTVTDQHGCDTILTVPVTEPPPLTATVVSTLDISCYGNADGNATASVTGGTAPYVYAWNSVPVQLNANASNLAAGTYTVTVTDVIGCTDTASTTITEPPQIFISLTVNHVSCTGDNDGEATAAVSGGVPPYTYVWNTVPAQTTAQATGLSAGIYSVTITDLGGCDTTLTAVITEPSPFNASIVSSVNVDCNGSISGQAAAVATGGTLPYAYQWNTLPVQYNDTAQGLPAGNYTLTVTDSMGCSDTVSVIITEPPLLQAQLSSQTNVSCAGGNDGSAFVTASGGTPPYTFNWMTTPVQSGPLATNFSAGTYQCIIVDASGCQDTVNVSITEPPPVTANVTVVAGVSCFEGSDGIMTVSASNGTAPYTFLWSDGQTTATATGLSHGNYSVTVTDANGCSVSATGHVHQPDELWGIVLNNSDETCPGSSDGTVTVNGVDGTPPYSFVWNTSPLQTSLTATGLTAGSYIVTITDSNGCDTALPVSVGVNMLQASDLQLTLSDSITCAGDTALLTLTVQNAQSGYSYIWNNGLDSVPGPFFVFPQSNTLYSVTVTDQCGNPVSDSIPLTVNPLPLTGLPPVIATGCTPLFVAFLDTLNNSALMNYIWDFGDGTTSQITNPGHTYTVTGSYNIQVTVTSPAGCQASASGTGQVVVYPDPQAGFEADPWYTDMSAPDIQFTDQSGGNPIAWYWSFGDGLADSVQNPLHTYADTGSFKIDLTVYNQYGCADTASGAVHLEPWYELIIPNAFTPSLSGGSGGIYDPNALNNDVFYPITDFVSDFHMMIFNRWGELIFESFDINIGWDGYYRDQLCQQDVYAYKIEITYLDGNVVTRVGNVTLFR